MNPCRHAFSLLELVLAVGLSIALVALLGFAFDLHLTKLDASRSTIERAQVARAILDRVAADLRGATSAPTQDISERLAAAEAASRFDVDEVDATAEAGGDDSGDQADASAELYPAGVASDGVELIIDRRSIAQDLVTPTEGGAPTARVVGAWRRVRYAMSADAATPGLVRTEASRDADVWRSEQGQQPAAVLPIAPEVLSFEMRFYDGEQYLEAWDMQERQALPLAVEVIVELASTEDEEALRTSELSRASRRYRRFVRLPAAAAENETGQAEEANDGAGAI